MKSDFEFNELQEKLRVMTEKYEILCRELEEEVPKARALYNDMKANDLHFSTYEAEGYLRGSITAFNKIKWVEEIYNS